METDRYNHFSALKTNLCEEVLQVTIDDFSLEIVDQYIHDLLHLIEILQQDQVVKIVVFHSTDPDFYLVNCYINPAHEEAAIQAVNHLHFQLWAQVLMGLAILPQTKVAIVEDKVRDAGNGFLWACDLTIHCPNAGLNLLSLNLHAS